MIIVTSLFSKSSVFEMFSGHTKIQSRKAPFSCQIIGDDRPNCRNKAAFLNFAGAVWTALQATLNKAVFRTPENQLKPN